MANYKRAQQRFVAAGTDLNHPVDLMPPGKVPLLMNLRSFQDGRIETRPGYTNLIPNALGDLNTHTDFRMNDYVAGSFLRFIGAGTNLYNGNGSNSVIGSGYSGNPLSVVPYLPSRSVNVWGYVGDSNKQRKYNASGTERNWGIVPPMIIPSAELNPPAYTTPTGSDATSPFNQAGSWGNTGSTTTPTLNPITMPGRLVGLQISTIVYLTGATGWALIAPTAGASTPAGAPAIVAGMRIQIGTGGGGTTPPTGNVEYATVEEVHKIYSASAPTIGGIIYDSGTSGLCTIQPSVNMAGLSRNSLLQLNSEWTRIISVTNGANGITSFRCSTSGTHTNGESISIPANGNFFIYLTGTHVSGEYLWCSVYQFEVNPGSKGGQGLVYANAATGSPWSLAIAGGRPLTPDDYLHISIWTDHPEYISQCQLIVDVDPGTTVSHQATDGTYNAYIKTLRGSDFQQFISNLQTADNERTTSIQLDLQNQTTLPLVSNLAPQAQLGVGQSSTPVDISTDQPTAPPLPILGSTTSQLTTGATQWTEFKFKLSEFSRIGSVQISDWSQVHAILLSFVVTNNVFVSMAGMWSGGTYGPDTGNNLAPMVYRYRYRSSTVGPVSLPGPAMRTGITAHRQGVLLTAVASSDPQVDKIDFERYGGSNLSWHYVGTADNGTPSLLDDQLNAAVLTNDPLETDTYQPFTIAAAPITVTANVAGSAISLTSGTISTQMAIGTEVIVNGVLTEVYAIPSSSTLFHVADSMGYGTGVTVIIQEPILAGQTLPAVWGPFQETIFGVGNPLDAGSFYYTKPQDPDSSADTNRVSVTSPSEQLMNGIIWDTKNYLWSDQAIYQITPNFGGTSDFVSTKIYSGKGLAYRWALTAGPRIWFVSQDGIYEFAGGEPVLISKDIQPLFPQGDSPGIAVRGIPPINMALPLRLCYINRYLFFDYTDTGGALRTWVCDTTTGSWFYDQYGHGITFHGVETNVAGGQEIYSPVAGTNNGFIVSLGGTTDAGIPIPWEADTQAFNADDLRARKIWGDLVFDANTNSAEVNATPWIDLYSTVLPTFFFNTPQRAVTNPFSFVIDTFGKNLGIKFAGTGFVQLYSWEPSFLLQPEDTGTRATDWDNAGYEGTKFLQGFILEANTFGQARTVQLEIDYQNIVAPYTVNHAGQQELPYVLIPAQTGHMFRLVPTDPDLWDLFSVKWVWEPAPELVTYWETQTTTHDIDGYQFLKDGYIAIQSTAQITLLITVDGVIFHGTLPSTGGLYQKLYIVFPQMVSGQTLKGKLFKYILQSDSPFRLFQRDSEIRVHAWGGGDYVVKHPFGDVSRINGARI